MPEEKPHDVIIIGAGPAGLTAAIYTGRALLPALVIEKAVPGGQLNETDLIENWPGFEEAVAAPELMEKLRRQAARFGATILQDEVVRIEPGEGTHRVVTPHGLHTARTAILAPGSRPRELPAKGAARLKGRGVSYCATCDGPFYKEQDIAVVGGGNTAIQEAIHLTKFARKVTVIHRRKELRATRIVQDKAFANDKIDFIFDAEVTEIKGGENGVEQLI
ncbi:MAG TPA: FAD-binding protein, partial [Candidatus Acetothermia bacterium]|nr:FAD-binding protein [Candidatus Acetothermia bacterium]